MRLGLACLAGVAATIALVWAWLGVPVVMPHAPLTPGEKLWCVSYAPFRGLQTPFNADTFIPASQIEEDLTRLAKITDCVRIYSADQGLEQVLPMAAKLGLKVLQGFWLSADPVKNAVQLEIAIGLVNRYPDTVRAVVVGNEVLLRGEMSALDLAKTIRAVKARVKVPVTYADVWEFWLRNRDLANIVDFVTVHILPYWEDFPIPAPQAADHVDRIRRQVAEAFPGKDVVIGEVGWPSAGRMREGALPSPSNQARVIQDVLALAKRENYRVNVIEAFDQPWKRGLEGVVGGHWGLLDDASREPKFVWGEAVSNHPAWKWQALGGIAFAALVFAVAFAAGGGGPMRPLVLAAVTGNALAGGLLIGWTVLNVPVESLFISGWIRSLVFAAVAILTPPVLSIAAVRGMPLPRFSDLLGPVSQRARDPLTVLIGILMIATLLLALIVALGLVFDPRYRDFPFAPLVAAAVPLLLQSLCVPSRGGGLRSAAELAGAAVLALSVLYILFNESFANWQSIWLCAALAALAVSLARVRGAPG